MIKDKVVLEDVGVGENGAKAQFALEYSSALPRTRLQRNMLMNLGDMLKKRHGIQTCRQNLSLQRKLLLQDFLIAC